MVAASGEIFMGTSLTINSQEVSTNQKQIKNNEKVNQDWKKYFSKFKFEFYELDKLTFSS